MRKSSISLLPAVLAAVVMLAGCTIEPASQKSEGSDRSTTETEVSNPRDEVGLSAKTPGFIPELKASLMGDESEILTVSTNTDSGKITKVTGRTMEVIYSQGSSTSDAIIKRSNTKKCDAAANSASFRRIPSTLRANEVVAAPSATLRWSAKPISLEAAIAIYNDQIASTGNMKLLAQCDPGEIAQAHLADSFGKALDKKRLHARLNFLRFNPSTPDGINPPSESQDRILQSKKMLVTNGGKYITPDESGDYPFCSTYTVRISNMKSLTEELRSLPNAEYVKLFDPSISNPVPVTTEGTCVYYPEIIISEISR